MTDHSVGTLFSFAYLLCFALTELNTRFIAASSPISSNTVRRTAPHRCRGSGEPRERRRRHEFQDPQCDARGRRDGARGRHGRREPRHHLRRRRAGAVRGQRHDIPSRQVHGGARVVVGPADPRREEEPRRGLHRDAARRRTRSGGRPAGAAAEGGRGQVSADRCLGILARRLGHHPRVPMTSGGVVRISAVLALVMWGGGAELGADWAQPNDRRATVTLRGHAQTLHLYGPADGVPVIMTSGDGGWMHLSPHVAELLGPKGFLVIGFDAKAYLESFTQGTNRLRVEDEP